MVVKEKSIGRVGKHYVNQNQREGWASRIWLDSVRPCWRDRCGGCKQKKHHCSTKCLVQNISPHGWFLMQEAPRDRMHGKAYLKQDVS